MQQVSVISIPQEPYYRARYYDPTLGKFLAEDPVQFDSKQDNFYEYVANNPQRFVDPSGNYITPVGSTQDIHDLGLALAYLLKDPVMSGIVHQMLTDPDIEYVIDMRPGDYPTQTDIFHHRILWWPRRANIVCANGAYQSPALALGHELDHALNGKPGRGDQQYGTTEERRVIEGSERHAAYTLGEPQRYDHADHPYVIVPTPTSHSAVPKN